MEDTHDSSPASADEGPLVVPRAIDIVKKSRQGVRFSEHYRSIDSAYFTVPSGPPTFSSYLTARSYSGSARNVLHNERVSVYRNQDYARNLRDMNVLQPPEEELNWAGNAPGTGQHAEFLIGEELPFEVLGNVAKNGPVVVDRVLCRRILLARKMVRWNYRMKLQDAMNELKHLNASRHAHILKLVGSYVQGSTFAMLLYPVADSNLQDFYHRIEDIFSTGSAKFDDYLAVSSMLRFFSCLASGLEHIHAGGIKHMDIKPQNILVKEAPGSLESGGDTPRFQIYISDFGISRSFEMNDEESSQTDGRTAFTRKYCAPEVFFQDRRGRSADIFSLGAVFLEMASVLCYRSTDDFDEFRSNGTSSSAFHENLDKVSEWLEQMEQTKSKTPLSGVPNKWIFGEVDRMWPVPQYKHSILGLVPMMLEVEPKNRPTAFALVEMLGTKECCAKRHSFVTHEHEKRVKLTIEDSEKAWIEFLYYFTPPDERLRDGVLTVHLPFIRHAIGLLRPSFPSFKWDYFADAIMLYDYSEAEMLDKITAHYGLSIEYLARASREGSQSFIKSAIRSYLKQNGGPKPVQEDLLAVESVEASALSSSPAGTKPKAQIYARSTYPLKWQNWFRCWNRLVSCGLYQQGLEFAQATHWLDMIEIPVGAAVEVEEDIKSAFEELLTQEYFPERFKLVVAFLEHPSSRSAKDLGPVISTMVSTYLGSLNDDERDQLSEIWRDMLVAQARKYEQFPPSSKVGDSAEFFFQSTF